MLAAPFLLYIIRPASLNVYFYNVLGNMCGNRYLTVPHLDINMTLAGPFTVAYCIPGGFI